MDDRKNSKAKIQANNKYRKANYKRICIDIKPEWFDLINEYCLNNNVSKAGLISKSCEYIINNNIKLD